MALPFPSPPGAVTPATETGLLAAMFAGAAAPTNFQPAGKVKVRNVPSHLIRRTTSRPLLRFNVVNETLPAKSRL